MTDQPDMNDWCRRAAALLGEDRLGWDMFHHIQFCEPPHIIALRDRIILAALLVTECERRQASVWPSHGMVHAWTLCNKAFTQKYTQGDTESRIDATIISTVTALESLKEQKDADEYPEHGQYTAGWIVEHFRGERITLPYWCDSHWFVPHEASTDGGGCSVILGEGEKGATVHWYPKVPWTTMDGTPLVDALRQRDPRVKEK